MIQLVPQLRILLACQPVDFRCGIDGLAALCRQQLAENPMSGTLFVFRNRSGTALKLLCYDGLGYYLVTRRFSHGRVRSLASGPRLTSAFAGGSAALGPSLSGIA
jgi:transposase